MEISGLISLPILLISIQKLILILELTIPQTLGQDSVVCWRSIQPKRMVGDFNFGRCSGAKIGEEHSPARYLLCISFVSLQSISSLGAAAADLGLDSLRAPRSTGAALRQQHTYCVCVAMYASTYVCDIRRCSFRLMFKQ